MAKKSIYTFIINIEDGGESFVDFEVNAKEKKLIDSAMEDFDTFEDVEELSDLYDRVMIAAKEKLQEDLDLTGDTEIDVDSLEYSVDFNYEEDI